MLYGDWSAKWHGDPKQQILWWDNRVGDSWGAAMRDTTGSWGYYAASYSALLNSSTASYSTMTDYSVHATERPNYKCSTQVWHLFDVANSSDVDIEN